MSSLPSPPAADPVGGRSLGTRKHLRVAALVAVALALGWRFPLFHVVPRTDLPPLEGKGFGAARFARQFWSQKLVPATDGAVDLRVLIAALSKDPARARQEWGRSVGLGSAAVAFVKGEGLVTAIAEDFVQVALTDGKPGTEVRLATGLLFGNTVRDATGLIDVSAYADSQDFNQISTELNRIVEAEISPALRMQAAVGRTIRFAGCVELDENVAAGVWSVVPVKIEWP